MEGTEGRSTGGGSVLVPTGTALQSYACMRSLNRRGIDTVVASECEGIPHFGSRYCSEQVRLSAPPQDVSAYKDELLAIASRPGVEAIIPVREFDAYVLAKYGDEFVSEASFLSPDFGTLARTHDRLQLAREAEEAGVPVANTRLLPEVDEWNTDQVVKSRYNLLTGEYTDSIPQDAAEEVRKVQFLPAGARPDHAGLREEMKHDPIVQEFVPQADKILYTALWERGEPVATYQHRQIRQNSWVGGGGVYRKSVYSPSVERVAHDLLGHLDWHGLACIEYLRDATTDEWKFLEINPRTWQSLPEAVRAGVDFPYYYWLRARGEAGRIDDDYEAGIGCHLAYGELSHLLSVLRDESPFAEPPSFGRTLWEIATSCLLDPGFDYLRLDDPGLALGAVLSTLSMGVTASRQYDSATPAPDDERSEVQVADGRQ